MPFKPIVRVSSYTEFHTLVHDTIAKEGMHCDLNHIDVSQMTSMRGLFAGSDFNGNISQWDVSGVVDFTTMFSNASFAGDISKWDTRSALTMRQMFRMNESFQGDISGWDVSSVMDFLGMFNRAEFNGDLSRWDIQATAFESVLSSRKCLEMKKPSVFHWYQVIKDNALYTPQKVLHPLDIEHFERMRPMVESLVVSPFAQARLYQKSWLVSKAAEFPATIDLPELIL